MKQIGRIFFFLSVYSFTSYAQVIITGGGKIKIDGGTSSNPIFMVLTPPASQPIKVSGTTDGIIMEAEYNRLQFNLSTATTSITVPYMASLLEQFSLVLVPTTAGVGAGNIRFSTTVAANRATGFDNMTYKPSDVTNMGSLSSANNSAKTIDRFWIIDANGYTTNPAVTLHFTYIDAEWGTNGGNSIAESGLRAQRFNNSVNDWQGYVNYLPAGSINTTANTVSNVVVSSSDFFKSWTLNDNSIPLPIELLNFDASCVNNNTVFEWCTASEKNNNYFTIEQSVDGINFQPIGTVQGNDSSNSKHCYKFTIPANSGLTYYTLKQTDFKGAHKYSNIISVDCHSELNALLNTELTIYPNPNNGSFTIASNESGTYKIVNELGQYILEFNIDETTNYKAFISGLSSGIYFVVGINQHKIINKKIVVTN